MPSTGMNTVFLLDVDNTLLDNDRIAQDLRSHLERAFGVESRDQYWGIFEQLRAELGYADYLGALQRYRIEHPRDPHILEISSYLIDYPFRERLYPGVLDVMARLRSSGLTVILRDGDAVFQPRKVSRSGLWDAVEGRVLIYIHKERMLDDVELKYPAEHYVMVDDKLRILSAMKNVWRNRLTSVWVVQGHYANDPKEVASYPAADVRLEGISELAGVGPELLLRRATAGSPPEEER